MRLTLAILLVGCGTSSTGPDGSVPNDSGAPDHWHGCINAASVTSCLPEYPPCPDAFDGGCGTTDGGRISVGTCGGFTVWAASGKDTTERVYYDSAGNVVAVTNESVVGAFCVAGSTEFTPPTTCTLEMCDGG